MGERIKASNIYHTSKNISSRKIKFACSKLLSSCSNAGENPASKCEIWTSSGSLIKELRFGTQVLIRLWSMLPNCRSLAVH